MCATGSARLADNRSLRENILVGKGIQYPGNQAENAGRGER